MTTKFTAQIDSELNEGLGSVSFSMPEARSRDFLTDIIEMFRGRKEVSRITMSKDGEILRITLSDKK